MPKKFFQCPHCHKKISDIKIERKNCTLWYAYQLSSLDWNLLDSEVYDSYDVYHCWECGEEISLEDLEKQGFNIL